MKATAAFVMKPGVQAIETVKNKSGQFFRSHGLPEELVQEQIMIVDELVELGAYFSNVELSANPITVEINVDDNELWVEVSQPVDEAADNKINHLDKAIQMIRGFQDPYEAYLQLKRSTAARNGQEKMGFQLVKIACEGHSIVDYFVDEAGILYLSAVRRLAVEYHR